jgi:hypothetical protein
MTTLTASPAPVKSARKPTRPVHGVCGLTLSINGARSKVHPIDGRAEGPGRAYRLTKQAADGAVYDLAEDQDGAVGDCPDFVYRREGLDAAGCKHIRAARACGLLSPMRKGVAE